MTGNNNRMPGQGIGQGIGDGLGSPISNPMQAPPGPPELTSQTCTVYVMPVLTDTGHSIEY